LSERLKRPVSGILLVDKPAGITSNACLQKARYLYRAEKAGHTGALDPLATGVLPICLGEATKVSQFLLDATKEYAATIRLGSKTTTADSEGELIGEADVPAFDAPSILPVLATFLGESRQVPPDYSALKQNGVPLYKLAREGREIEKKIRLVTIHELELLDYRAPFLHVRVLCSKGTYIRSLAEDIAVALGTLGHVSELRRLQSGPFRIEQCHTLESLAAIEDFSRLDALLVPMDQAVAHLPLLMLSEVETRRLRQGQQFTVNADSAGEVRVYEGDTFIGIGRVAESGTLSAVRLLSY
jgi:tRNA pseudouridine55 synthase